MKSKKNAIDTGKIQGTASLSDDLFDVIGEPGSVTIPEPVIQESEEPEHEELTTNEKGMMGTDFENHINQCLSMILYHDDVKQMANVIKRVHDKRSGKAIENQE